MFSFTVTELKQYLYCPREIYFTYCQPINRKISKKMDYGKEEHHALKKLEERRTLQRYGLDRGQRKFNLFLKSDRLGLRGRLDMLIETDRELIPVEFKNSTYFSTSFKYQTTAYVYLVEENFKRPVRRGMIYLIPEDRIESIKVTPGMRNFLKGALKKMRKIVMEEYIPEKASGWKRCKDCEYQNFCADVG